MQTAPSFEVLGGIVRKIVAYYPKSFAELLGIMRLEQERRQRCLKRQQIRSKRPKS